MFELPKYIMIEDKDFHIRNDGDFRVILDCFECLNDEELPENCRVYSALIVFYEDLNSIEDITDKLGKNIEVAVEEMFKFFRCGQDDIGTSVQHKIIDWKKDEQMICAGINGVAQTEIRSVPYLHWYTFMGYYVSVPSETLMGNVLNIRMKIAKGKKLEKYEQDFKRNSPQYFNIDNKTKEDKDFERNLFAMWNKT